MTEKEKDNIIRFGGYTAFVIPNGKCDILEKIIFYNNNGIVRHVGAILFDLNYTKDDAKEVEYIYLPDRIVSLGKKRVDFSKKGVFLTDGEVVEDEERSNLWIHTDLLDSFNLEHTVEMKEDIDNMANDGELPLKVVRRTRYEYDTLSFKIMGRFYGDNPSIDMPDEVVEFSLQIRKKWTK